MARPCLPLASFLHCKSVAAILKSRAGFARKILTSLSTLTLVRSSRMVNLYVTPFRNAISLSASTARWHNLRSRKQ